MKKAARRKILAVLTAFLAGALTLVALIWVMLPRDVTQPSNVGGPFTLIDQNGKTVT